MHTNRPARLIRRALAALYAALAAAYLLRACLSGSPALSVIALLWAAASLAVAGMGGKGDA